VIVVATMSARDFNRDVSAAKRAAADGPVVITDRGEPAFVLLSIDDYRRLHDDGRDLVERLSMDDDLDDIDFEPVPARLGLKVPEL
jgi:prevent-host-death family protein